MDTQLIHIINYIIPLNDVIMNREMLRYQQENFTEVYMHMFDIISKTF